MLRLTEWIHPLRPRHGSLMLRMPCAGQRCAGSIELSALSALQTSHSLKYGHDIGLGMYATDAIALLQDTPLFICHGTKDIVIGIASSVRLASAAHSNPNLEPLCIVDGAHHCGLFDAGGDDFKDKLSAFIHKCFKTKPV